MKNKVYGKMKKAASIIAVTAIVFSMSMPVAVKAEECQPQITVTNAKGGIYEAKQLFSGKIADSVLVDIKWGADVIDEAQLLEDLVANNTVIGVTFTTEDTASDVAYKLKGLGDDSVGMKKFAEVVASHLKAGTHGTVDDGEYVINLADVGYYLVENTPEAKNDAISRFICEVVDCSGITVESKKAIPTVEKKVLEDSDIKDKLIDSTNIEEYEEKYGENYNDIADWAIGETGSFGLYANLPEEIFDYKTYNLYFHDTYAEGIAVNEDSVQVDYKAGSEWKPLNGANKSADNNEEDHTLTITIKDVKKTLIENHVTEGPVTIKVQYDAKLTKDAQVFNLDFDGNENKVKMSYTNDPYYTGEGKESTGTTEEDKVVVYTYGLYVEKVGEGENPDKLAGAKFRLYKDSNNGKEYATLDSTGSNITGWTTDIDVAGVVTTPDSGKVLFQGLDSEDNYYLEEIEAPVGYNKLLEPIKLTIVPTLKEHTQTWDEVTTHISDVQVKSEGTTATSLKVVNKKGLQLPSTGDMGTPIFYLIGSLTSLVAMIVLVTKKRFNKQNCK